MIGDHLQTYTFEYLLQNALQDIPDTIDKRQGSIIYDTLAGMAKMAAQGFAQIRQVYGDTFAQYAVGEPLGLRTEEDGIKRKQATKALRQGTFFDSKDQPIDVPIGSRFSAIDGEKSIVYKVKERIAAGVFSLEAETAGSVGNDYIGPILPIDVLSGLATATIGDIIIPGSDTEDDDSLRQRYFDAQTAKPFGGNIAQYRAWVNEREGIGACQIYPIWAGGGTVKISAVDSDYAPLTVQALDDLQQAIDPTRDGQGLGTAPIGHIVTVSTPEEVVINVAANVQTALGFTPEQLAPLVAEEIDIYLRSLRRDWGNPVSQDINAYALAVYQARIMAVMLRVKGVLNVTELTLNGQDEDIILTQTAQRQQLPKLGVVSLE